MTPEAKFILIVFLGSLIGFLIDQIWTLRKYNRDLLNILSELKNHEGNKLIPTIDIQGRHDMGGRQYLLSWLTPLLFYGVLIYHFLVV